MPPSRSFDPSPEVIKLREFLVKEGWKCYVINSLISDQDENIDDSSGHEEHILNLRFEKGVESIEVTSLGIVVEANCSDEAYSIITQKLIESKQSKNEIILSKVNYEKVLIHEQEYALVVSNQGQKRKLFPYAEKINFEPQFTTKEDNIGCPHFKYQSKFLESLSEIDKKCNGFVVEDGEVIPKSGQSVQGINRKEFEKIFSIGECKNNVTARHGYCSNCNKKFKEWKKIRQVFSNRFFNSNFLQKGYSEQELELLHNSDDCWPLKIQSNDWIGFLKIPSHNFSECKMNILAHEDIVDAVMKWLSYCGNARCEHSKCAKVDTFVKRIVSNFHQKISDATTMQYMLKGVHSEPPYNLHLDDSENVSADQMCEIISNLVDEFFPSSEFSNQVISLPMNHIAYYRRPQGQGKTDYAVPVRIVMASFALATALEESNRGDARWDRLKQGFTAYYANIWMPMGIYFLMRNGASLAKAKKAIKQA